MSWQVETPERFLAANPESRIFRLPHLASDLAAKMVRLGGGSLPNWTCRTAIPAILSSVPTSVL